jgi:hypothetical protein
MTTLNEIRAQLKPVQNSPTLREIIEKINKETLESALTADDLFTLMSKETDPKRMYKLAKLYIILVEEQFGKNQ